MITLPPVDSIINHDNSNNFSTIYRISKTTPVCHNNQTPFVANSSRFWVYNTHNKGPKKSVFSNFEKQFQTSAFNYTDPVKQLPIGINSTKANKPRKNESSSTTPNCQKFLKIGKSIFNVNQTYKKSFQKNEKNCPKMRNILASRLCRLKKKAYHEALKIKYCALGVEYKEIRQIICNLQNYPRNAGCVSRDKLCQMNIIQAAGRLDDFVEELYDLLKRRDVANPVVMKIQNSRSEEEVESYGRSFEVDLESDSESGDYNLDDIFEYISLDFQHS